MRRAPMLLKEAMIQNDSLACCGLDPDISKMPTEITSQHRSNTSKVFQFLSEIVDLTSSHVCAYKIQKAFFDVFPGGRTLLADVVGYVQTRYPKIPVFIDAKIGDIDNTMEAYLHNVFNLIGADGLVVNPYMGDDVLLPFERLEDKVGIVLVKTSNPGASIVQDVILANGMPLWHYVLGLVVERWNKASNLIPVIASTAGIDLGGIRKIVPDEMPILFAGVGAQGGSLRNMSQLLDSNGRGVFVNSSRGLLYPYESSATDWREQVVDATIALKRALNSERIMR